MLYTDVVDARAEFAKIGETLMKEKTIVILVGEYELTLEDGKLFCDITKITPKGVADGQRFAALVSGKSVSVRKRLQPKDDR